MKITIAGPGAGKTSNLAIEVCDRQQQIQEAKWIFVIAYTNNAVKVIKDKLETSTNSATKRVSVSTIHSFLLSEFIFPYNHFLYDHKFTEATSIQLPNDYSYKAKRCSELHDGGIIHNSEVFKMAKYLLVGKSNDTKSIKTIRDKILSNTKSYISDIFVDEAQDIDDDVCECLQVFERIGVNITLIGDPKQNIKACTGFARLSELYQPNYLADNYRSPKNHVTFLNNFVPNEQKQTSHSSIDGELHFILGNIISPEMVLKQPWDLTYIYEKSHDFDTKSSVDNLEEFFNSVLDLLKELQIDEPERNCFNILNSLQNENKYDGYKCINQIEKTNSLKLTNKQRARVHEACNILKNEVRSQQFIVSSIDRIKGCEGERCLFILTNDVAPYLMGTKANFNKAKSKLFVGLSRSTRNLTIYIHESVILKEQNKDLPSNLLSKGFIDMTCDYI